MLTRLSRLVAMFAVACALALSPSAAFAQGDAGAPVVYRVQAGDTLFGIASRFLASRDQARDLQRINRIADPRRMPVGHALRIPRAMLRFEPVSLRVASFSGPVEIGGNPAQVGTIVREGDVIETAARGFVTFMATGAGRISLPSNSRARVGKARRYVLDNLLDVDFEILEGRAEFQAPSLREQENFRTRTPVAVTAVRGTEYRIAYDPAAVLGTTEVTEGQVAVAAGEALALTDAGFGVSAGQGELSQPEALLPAPDMLQPGAIQTGEALDFAIEPLAGAVAYRVQLARDAGFLEVIDEVVTDAPEASFGSIDNGRYFVRSRAIAESRLEGLTETASFRRKRLGATASVGESPLGDGFLFAWNSEGEGQSYFAFQLWNTANPDVMLLDDVGLSANRLVVTELEPGSYAWRVASVQAEPEGLLKVWGPTQELLVSQ